MLPTGTPTTPSEAELMDRSLLCSNASLPPGLAAVLRAATPCTLYDPEEKTGDLAVPVREADELLTGVQQRRHPLVCDTPVARHSALLNVLYDAVDGVAARVRMLGQLGEFHFRRSETPDARRAQLTAILEPTPSDEQAAGLMKIWRPHTSSLLDTLLRRPAEAARLLSRGSTPRIVSHPLPSLGAESRQVFIKEGLVAWRTDDALHLAADVATFLRACGDPRMSALHLLLLHNRAMTHLDGEQVDSNARDLVAAVFCRCLSPDALPLAIESFFVEWESQQASAQPEAPSAAPATEATEGEDAWMDCVIQHEDLRPEAFVERTVEEQRKILREMFGDDWSDEDEAALQESELAA